MDFIAGLRSLVGSDVIIVGNGAQAYGGSDAFMPYLNGTIFETELQCYVDHDFSWPDGPCGNWTPDIDAEFIGRGGTWQGFPGYAPRLSVGWMSAPSEVQQEAVAAYGPFGPHNWSGWDAAVTSAAADMQRYRLGLGASLLAGMLFGADWGTYEHGYDMGLFWYPSFDTGGTGLGWLGSATAPSEKHLVTASLSANLLSDGTYESGIGSWNTWVDTAAGYAGSCDVQASASAPEGSSLAVCDITSTPGDPWADIYRIEWQRGNLPVEEGTYVTIQFWACADPPRWISVSVRQLYCATTDLSVEMPYCPEGDGTCCWEGYGGSSQNVFVGADCEEFTRTFGPVTIAGPDTSRSDARVLFDLGYTTGTVSFDDVRFYQGAAQFYWTRQFENGLVLVNTDTTRTATVDVGSGFDGVAGNPAGLDGTLSSAIDIAPLDAALLKAVP